MKKYLTYAIIFLSLVLVSCAEDDEWKASEVCPEAGTNRYGMPNRGEFTDERDGQVYKYTTIGDQVWMAENLKYNAPYSLCPDDSVLTRIFCSSNEILANSTDACEEFLCNMYGRYYSIIENGEGNGLIDRALADTICAKGWHVPTKDEWESLFAVVTGDDGEKKAADRLKSSDSTLFLGGGRFITIGSNACGFSAFTSGFYPDDEDMEMSAAYYLSSTQISAKSVSKVVIDNSVRLSENSYRNSIRCLKD